MFALLVFSPVSRLLLAVSLLIGLVGTLFELLFTKLSLPEQLQEEEVSFFWRWHRFLRYWYSLMLWLVIAAFPFSVVGIVLYLSIARRLPALHRIAMTPKTLTLEYRSGLTIQLFWRDIDRIEHDSPNRRLIIYGGGEPITIEYAYFEDYQAMIALVQRHMGGKFY